MFALPETKQVTFDGSVNAAFDPPVDVWWDNDEQMKMFFFPFFDIQYPVSAASIANTSNQSCHRS